MLSALALAAAVEGTFTLTDRTETRVRAPDPTTNTTAFDVENDPDARLALRTPKVLYTLGYTPRIAYVDFNDAGAKPSLLNSGVVSGQWHERRVKVTVTEAASYGYQSFSSLSVAPATGAPSPIAGTGGAGAGAGTGTTTTPVAQAVPSVELVKTLSTTSTLQSEIHLRKVDLTGLVAYSVSGGADAFSKAALPEVHGPNAEADADLTVSGRDHFVTVATASDQTFSLGVQSELAELDEHWRHRFSRATDTEVGVGIAVTSTRLTPTSPATGSTDPVVNGAINEQLSRGIDHFLLRAESGLGPTVNRLTGIADQRVYGTVQGSWNHKKVGLRLFGTATESVPQSAVGALRLFEGEVTGVYHATKIVTFDAGVRGLWESQTVVALPPTNTGTTTTPQGTTAPGLAPTFTVFLAVTVNAMNSRF